MDSLISNVFVSWILVLSIGTTVPSSAIEANIAIHGNSEICGNVTITCSWTLAHNEVFISVQVRSVPVPSGSEYPYYYKFNNGLSRASIGDQSNVRMSADSFDVNNNRAVVRITNVQCADEGNYSCYFTTNIPNQRNPITQRFLYLTVPARPKRPVIRWTPNTSTAILESSIIRAICSSNVGHSGHGSLQWKIYRRGVLEVIPPTDSRLSEMKNVPLEAGEDSCTQRVQQTFNMPVSRADQNLIIACFVQNDDFQNSTPERCLDPDVDMCSQTQLFGIVWNAPSSIVSTNTITSGGQFSVYCDAGRVNVPHNVHSIAELTISRNLSTTNSYSLVARYYSLPLPGLNGSETHIPNGRNWSFTFSGDNNGVNNFATMKLVWDVNDVSCADAGIYRCGVDFILTTGESSFVQATNQNLTITPGLSRFDLTVSPTSDMNEYNVDDNITFTCSALGPASGLNFRWEFWAKNEFDIEQSQPLPSNNEIGNKPATLQTGNTGCAQYSWVSTLRIQVPDYEQQSYKCIVTYMQQEESGNVTIGITSVPVMSKSTEGADINVGAVVGGVVGGLVVLAGAVSLIIYFKRRDDLTQDQDVKPPHYEEIDLQ